jgi:catechol-2,3-dioxygenase
VTKLNGDASQWETHKLFLDNIEGNRIKVLTLKEMLDDIESNVKNTLESSEVGRLLQVIKASGWDGIARKDTVSSSTRIK